MTTSEVVFSLILSHLKLNVVFWFLRTMVKCEGIMELKSFGACLCFLVNNFVVFVTYAVDIYIKVCQVRF